MTNEQQSQDLSRSQQRRIAAQKDEPAPTFEAREAWRDDDRGRVVATRADAKVVMLDAAYVNALEADRDAQRTRAEEAERETQRVFDHHREMVRLHEYEWNRAQAAEARISALEEQVRTLEQERDQWREALLYMQMPKCAQCALRGSDVNRCQATDCPHAPRNRALSQHPTEGAS